MENKYQSFETLLIWQEGMKICYLIYDHLKDCRDFGLKNQMEKSAVSIPSNIAEGYELNSDRGFIRHLYIAKGSSGELRTQLNIAIHQNYIASDVGQALLERCRIESAMIQKFIRERKKRLMGNIIKSIISLLVPTAIICFLAPLIP